MTRVLLIGAAVVAFAGVAEARSSGQSPVRDRPFVFVQQPMLPEDDDDDAEGVAPDPRGDEDEDDGIEAMPPGPPGQDLDDEDDE
jgi:hypothetical protein